MAEFDLDRLIRDELARSREADPYVIARRLVMRVPDEHRREALGQCLGDRVAIKAIRQHDAAMGLGDTRPASIRPEPGEES